MLWSTYVSHVLGKWLWTGVFNPVSMPLSSQSHQCLWLLILTLRLVCPTAWVVSPPVIKGSYYMCYNKWKSFGLFFVSNVNFFMLLFDQKLFPLYVTDLCFVSLNCAGPFWNNDTLTLKFSLMMCLVLYLYWCYCPMVHGFLCAGVHRQS